MRKKYLLITTPIDKYHNTINNEKIPDNGFINSNNYNKNYNLDEGFVGFLWGNISSIELINSKLKWAVIKIEDDNYLKQVHLFNNLYKFKHGIVLYKGNLNDVKNYIKKIRIEFKEEFRKDFQRSIKCSL